MDDSGVCTIRFDPQVGCVVMVWKGYATSEEFRAGNERVLAAILETGATRLLGEVTDFKLIGATDQQWLNDNWIPRAVQAGLRRVALIQPVYYFNRVAIETVAQRVDPATLEIGYFTDLDAARAWLAPV